MKFPRLKFALLMLFFFMLGFNMLIPWLDKNSFASAATTASHFPTADGDTKDEWTNPQNCYASDDAYGTSVASAATNEEDFYHFHASGTDLVTTLTNAKAYTIDGITVSVEAKASSFSSLTLDIKLSWDSGGSYTAAKSDTFAKTEATKTYGGSADNWGRTWSAPYLGANEFANTNFLIYGHDATTGYTLSVDCVSVTVTYTADTTAPVTSVGAISPYRIKFGTSKTITASATETQSGMTNVKFYYRYSSDNASWGAWTEYSTDSGAPFTASFTFPSGAGYYEFYSRGTDNIGNVESAPANADTRCKYVTAFASFATGYFTFGNTPTWASFGTGWFRFSNSTGWRQFATGYFTFGNTPAWSGDEGYFTFANTPAWSGDEGYFTFANTPAWSGDEGYFTFANAPAWSGDEGYFTFENTTISAWRNMTTGYFTFGNAPAWVSFSSGYFNFSNTPAWQGVSGYYTFGNTPSWSGVDGYFTFGNRDYTPIFANMTQGYFAFGNVTTDRTFEEGYFTFENIVSLTTFSEGYFTFANSPSWLGLDGYFTFGNSPSWIGSDGYFTFGNTSANQTIEEGWFTFENLTSSFRTFDDGWFSFNSSPTWHGEEGWFLFYSVRAWDNISQGRFSFENSVNYTNITQGYFNFSNSPSWQGTDGYFTFGNGAWQPIEQGWFTFENVSVWQTLNSGYFTFGNTSYMIIVSTFPADGDVICPTCYENDTFFYFNAHVDHYNGSLMNITWKTWNGTLLGAVNNVGNGTWHIVPFEGIINITYSNTYNYTINVTDGATFIEKVITFSTDTYTNCMMSTLSPEQFSAIIMLALFMFLFWVGYMGEKRSAGAFMLISGLVLIGEALVAWAYLPMSFGLLLVALGIFIALLGINKWLIKPNIPQKGEAKSPQ